MLVLGATGNAGTMAVQVAKRLGAGRVIGAGRDLVRLEALLPAGAGAVVQLTDDADATSAALAVVAGEADIVLDYLWGSPAQQAIMALLTARSDRSRALDWIQIGAVAGSTAEIPSAALRSANFRFQGCGQGSVSPRGYLAELPSLVAEITAGTIAVRPNPVPLSKVEEAWITSETRASAPSSSPSGQAPRLRALAGTSLLAVAKTASRHRDSATIWPT